MSVHVCRGAYSRKGNWETGGQAAFSFGSVLTRKAALSDILHFMVFSANRRIGDDVNGHRCLSEQIPIQIEVPPFGVFPTAVPLRKFLVRTSWQ